MKEGRIAGEVAKAQATPDALISSRCRASPATINRMQTT